MVADHSPGVAHIAHRIETRDLLVRLKYDVHEDLFQHRREYASALYPTVSRCVSPASPLHVCIALYTHQISQGLVSLLLGCHGGLRPDGVTPTDARLRCIVVCCVRTRVAGEAETAEGRGADHLSPRVSSATQTASGPKQLTALIKLFCGPGAPGPHSASRARSSQGSFFCFVYISVCSHGIVL
jgi:hypothetical protein